LVGVEKSYAFAAWTPDGSAFLVSGDEAIDLGRGTPGAATMSPIGTSTQALGPSSFWIDSVTPGFLYQPASNAGPFAIAAKTPGATPFEIDTTSNSCGIFMATAPGIVTCVNLQTIWIAQVHTDGSVVRTTLVDASSSTVSNLFLWATESP
jgi:hypothetical protein